MKFKKLTKYYSATTVTGKKITIGDRIKSGINSKLNSLRSYYKFSGSKDKKMWKQLLREGLGSLAGNTLSYIGAISGGIPGYLIGDRLRRAVSTVPNYDRFSQALLNYKLRNLKAKELREMRKARDRGDLDKSQYNKIRDANLNFDENTEYDKAKAKQVYYDKLAKAREKYGSDLKEDEWKTNTDEGKKAAHELDSSMNNYKFKNSKIGLDLYRTTKWKNNTVLSNLTGLNLPALQKLIDINRVKNKWKNYKKGDKNPDDEYTDLVKKRNEKGTLRNFIDKNVIGND